MVGVVDFSGLGEFWEIYALDVVEIPTNRPIARNDENDLVGSHKLKSKITHLVSVSQ